MSTLRWLTVNEQRSVERIPRADSKVHALSARVRGDSGGVRTSGVADFGQCWHDFGPISTRALSRLTICEEPILDHVLHTFGADLGASWPDFGIQCDRVFAGVLGISECV